jgi:MHS family proline/betaine transporter-like MFS transporter
MAAFGGTTPIVATSLVNRIGDDFALVDYVMATRPIALLVICV